MKQEIVKYLEKHQIKDKVSFFVYNTVTTETVLYREDVMMLAASTIKVPVVMAWIDLIEQGVVSWDTKLVYQKHHYEESDDKALYDNYAFGDEVPLKECMELAIVYSDNPSNHMMREYIKKYTGRTFRKMFAQYSCKSVSDEFYHRNLMNAEIMLEVMKRLYLNSEKYSVLIEWMKHAAEGRYIQSNHFEFEVAQKYGEYDCYEHTMAILYTKEPVLVGIFTELAGDLAKQVIRDISRIIVENRG